MSEFAKAACASIAATAVALLALPPRPAAAQASDYPSRKVTFVVGFAPGGGIDTMARIVAQGLGDRFGYQIVVENRPGAASNIAAKVVASASPDGYTLLFAGNSLAINAGRPARTLAEFLDASRGATFTFGYGGSSAHIVAEYVLKVLAKSPAIGVPFQSGAPTITALLGNHVDIIAGPVAEVYPQAQQGALRALAVTGARRAQAFPEVPTLNETGFPGLEINGWVGLLAPAKMPPEISAKLNAAVNAVVAEPAIDKRLRETGYEPTVMPVSGAAAVLKTSIEKWGRMLEATGITAE